MLEAQGSKVWRARVRRGFRSGRRTPHTWRAQGCRNGWNSWTTSKKLLTAPQTGCGFYNLGLLFIALRVQVSKSNFLSFVPHPSPPNEWSPRASGSLSQLIRVVPRACRGNIPSRVLSSCSERAPRGSLGRAATTGWPSGQTRCLLGRPPRARDDRQQSRSRDADADTHRQRSAPSRA